MKTFEEKLERGLRDEWLLCQWLRAKGYSIVPISKGAYDKHGPRLYTPQTDIIVPDMIVLEKDNVFLAESKGKDVFTWYRKTSQWQTGIDIRFFEHYQKAKEVSQWPIKIFFVHRLELLEGKGLQTEAPGPSPTGLFMAPLSVLETSVDHSHFGMHYWNIGNLVQMTPDIQKFYQTIVVQLKDRGKYVFDEISRMIGCPLSTVIKLYVEREEIAK